MLSAIVETKKCSCCAKVLPLTSFNKQYKAKGGVGYYCKTCSKLKNAKYLKLNKPAKRPSKRVYADKLNFTDIVVEEGRVFRTPKDFIKFKRERSIL